MTFQKGDGPSGWQADIKVLDLGWCRGAGEPAALSDQADEPPGELCSTFPVPPVGGDPCGQCSPSGSVSSMALLSVAARDLPEAG